MLQNAPFDAQDLMQRIANDLMDSYDEELELEIEDRNVDEAGDLVGHPQAGAPALLQGAVSPAGRARQAAGLGGSTASQKAVILFEGRDAAGKGGVIKRITQRLNPRVARVAALPAPNDRERTQWYFQRYAAHLPAAGEIVLFDRSWYNRAGVERVMGFCSDDEYEEFFRTVPEFEKMLVRSGIKLDQILVLHHRRRAAPALSGAHPRSAQAVEALPHGPGKPRRRWEAYTKAKEAMLERTHIPEAPWWVVPAVDKKKARLNCIRHLLSAAALSRKCRTRRWCCPTGCATPSICASLCRLDVRAERSSEMEAPGGLRGGGRGYQSFSRPMVAITSRTLKGLISTPPHLQGLHLHGGGRTSLRGGHRHRHIGADSQGALRPTQQGDGLPALARPANDHARIALMAQPLLGHA